MLWDINNELSNEYQVQQRRSLFNNEYFNAPSHQHHSYYTDERFSAHASLRVSNPSDEQFQSNKGRLSDVLMNGLTIPTEIKITPLDRATIDEIILQEKKLTADVLPPSGVWNRLSILHNAWRTRIMDYTWLPTNAEWYKDNVLRGGIYKPIPIFGCKGSPNSIELIMLMYKQKLFDRNTLFHILATIAVHAWCTINGRHLMYRPHYFNGSYPPTLTILYQQKDTLFKATDIPINRDTYMNRGGDEQYDESVDLYELALDTNLSEFAYYVAVKVCRHFYRYIPIDSDDETPSPSSSSSSSSTSSSLVDDISGNHTKAEKNIKRRSPAGTSKTMHGWFSFQLYINFNVWRSSVSRFVQHPIADIFNITRGVYGTLPGTAEGALECHSKHIFEVRNAQLYCMKFTYKDYHNHYLFPILYSHAYITTPDIPVIRPVCETYYDTILTFCWDLTMFSSKTIRDELNKRSAVLLTKLNNEINSVESAGVITILSTLPSSSTSTITSLSSSTSSTETKKPLIAVKSQCMYVYKATKKSQVSSSGFIHTNRYAPFISARLFRYLYTFNAKKLMLAPPVSVLTQGTMTYKPGESPSLDHEMDYLDPTRYSSDESSLMSMDMNYIKWCLINGGSLLNINRQNLMEKTVKWPLVLSVEQPPTDKAYLHYEHPIRICAVNGCSLWVYTEKVVTGCIKAILPLECRSFIYMMSSSGGSGGGGGDEYLLYRILCCIGIRHTHIIHTLFSIYGIESKSSDHKISRFMADLCDGEKLYHRRMLSTINGYGNSSYVSVIGSGIASINKYRDSEGGFVNKQLVVSEDVISRLPPGLPTHGLNNNISSIIFDGTLPMDGFRRHVETMVHIYSNVWHPILYYWNTKVLERTQYIKARTVQGKEYQWLDIHNHHNAGPLLAEAESITEHIRHSLETSDHQIMIHKIRQYKGGDADIDSYLQLMVNNLNRTVASRTKYQNLLSEAKTALINNCSVSSSSSSSASTSSSSSDIPTHMRVYIMHNINHYLDSTTNMLLPPNMLVRFYDILEMDHTYIGQHNSLSLMMSPDQRLVGILREIQTERPNMKSVIDKSIMNLQLGNDKNIQYQLHLIKMSYIKSSNMK